MSGQLKMLSAGAGAGKTYRLSNEIKESIEKGVLPENIMATTFTTKAAEELTERVRLMLLESGDHLSAARILDGYVGTMNSVFGRLLREFALELGLSPVQKVLAEKEASSIFQMIASEVTEKFYREYRQVFWRMGMTDTRDYDWRDTVLTIIEQARQNNMTSEDVQACAEFSWDIMNAWLPDPIMNAEQVENELKSALKVAKSQLPGGDETDKTKKVVETIISALQDWERNGAITWDMWAKLSKLSPGKSSKDAVSPIVKAASIHASHPKLHQDLKDTMFALFYCAAEAMDTYQVEKGKRGFIDFTDQESLALGLLSDKQHQEALTDRISEVFIDEFQDCSPLQMALSMKLREISQKATWVGDVKQAIYGFRGTDPELMQTAMKNIPDLEIEILDKSWRSRKSLVQFVNAVFVPVFEARGMSANQIALHPNREDKPEQVLAIEAWAYPDSKNKPLDALHLAIGVEKVLAQKEKYIVVDKVSREPRGLRAGDIAILCRKNDECVEVAEALSLRCIPATVGESGLLSTPEVIFAVAAMRYLVDAQDSLALAELIHFSSEAWGEGKWLSAWLEHENGSEFIRSEPIIQELDKARANILEMSPSEVLDLAIVSARVDEVSLQWGQGNQRLANLDALRKLAIMYEENAGMNRTTATTSGFLLFLEDVEKDKKLNLVAESSDHHAVRVLTYHKAKGLEWPFVILNSLGVSSYRDKPPVFNNVTAVSTEGFNVEDPLHGRRLYYWPWPYGKQSTKVGLDEEVSKAPQLIQKNQQLLDENQRLLYVGMTRARDYLVFAGRDLSRLGRLDELTDSNGNPVITSMGVVDEHQTNPQLDERDGKINVKGESFSCKVRLLSLEDGSKQKDHHTEEPETIYVGKSLDNQTFIPAHFIPSKQKNESNSQDGLQFQLETDVSKIHRIGNRLSLSGQPDMAVLGDMVHAFLAADDVHKEKEKRLAMAQAMRERFEIYALSPNAMMEASDRLTQFLSQRYPDSLSMEKEWPIHLRKGLQKASGWIDLLLQTPQGYVIIDHKSFPGKEADWLTRASSYLPQLQTYAEAVSRATGRPIIEAWIHMPVVGAMVNFTKEELEIKY